MRNLNKRRKTLLAFAVVVVVVIVAGIAILQPSGFGLFGTATYPYISPTSPSVQVGSSQLLTVFGSPTGLASGCTWSASNSIVKLMIPGPASVYVQGQALGSSTVKATCSGGTAYVNVWVRSGNPLLR